MAVHTRRPVVIGSVVIVAAVLLLALSVALTAFATTRVTNGLQVLYTFAEGSGTVVNDVSGVGTPLNLNIADTNAVTWLSGGGLSIDSATIISTTGAATKVIDAAQETDEISIEVWMKPANLTQDGPARMVTISADLTNRNTTLGQSQSGIEARLRSTATNDNGAPGLATASGAISATLTHVVFTRDNDGQRTLYIDGVQVASDTKGGNFSNWDAAYHLALGNELTADRPWLGELHLVAIYNRALTPAEVSQNYTVGLDDPDPTPTPPPSDGSRVTDGIQALYTFKEGTGTTIRDVSNVASALDLDVSNGNAIDWLPQGGLAITDTTTIASVGAATKIISAAQATNELTVEAWVKPANLSQSGPARMVTLSDDLTNRNFTLGQGFDSYDPTDMIDVRLRTTATDANGQPSLTTHPGSLDTQLTHIVFTRNVTGERKVYLDGVLAVNGAIGGDFSNWDGNYRLALANELTNNRPWLGEFHLVAIYDRALSAAEVDQNYQAGADITTPVADFTADPLAGTAPLAVTFTNQSTDADSYLWAFGDGVTSSLANPTHTYTQTGVYTVTLTAFSDVGEHTRSKAEYIIVTESNSRVAEGVQVLYTFEEGSGTTVQDVSGVGTPLDLTIADSNAVTWLSGGGLSVNTGGAQTIISSTVAAGKVINAATATNELTVEAWIQPANTTQDGPARIVTISGDPSNRNVTLGQGYWGSTPTDLFNVRLRTTTNDNNGDDPSVLTNAGTATTALTHVVYTRDSAGLVKMYIDGSEVTVDESLIDGDLSNWDGSYPLALADEVGSTGGRTWAGSYYLVAIYDQALSASEVAQNYNAGHLPHGSARSWQQITTTNAPPVWGEYALAYDGDRDVAVLYGGNGSGWPYENGSWEFDGADWTPITTTTQPNAVYGMAMVYADHISKTILFGGSDGGDRALAETWQYNGSEWSQLTTTTTPPARTGHALAYDSASDLIYLFGGHDGATYYDDLWQYDGSDWSQVTVNGGPPPARALPAMAYSSGDGRLLLFGGRDATGALLADTWSFDPATSAWSEDTASGPAARMAHGLVYDPTQAVFVLVGGAADDGDTILHDTWHYDGAGWTEASPTTAAPTTAYHRLVYDNTKYRMVLFTNFETWEYK